MSNLEFSIVPGTVGFLSFGQLAAHEVTFQELLRNNTSVICGTDRTGRLYQFLSSVIDSYYEKISRGMNQTLFDLQLAAFFVQLAETLNTHSVIPGNVHVQKAFRYMQANYMEDLSAEIIARQAGINFSYLQRLFRQLRGETMVDCLNRIRIEKAKGLLVNTNDDIWDIALNTGFHSRQYFARVFERLTGQTPSVYRKQYHVAHRKDVFLVGSGKDDQCRNKDNLPQKR